MASVAKIVDLMLSTFCMKFDVGCKDAYGTDTDPEPSNGRALQTQSILVNKIEKKFN